MTSSHSSSRLLDTQPSIARSASQQRFESLRCDVKGYRYTGRSNTYHWRHHRASTLHFQHEEPGTILDVGAGGGGVIDQLQDWGHEAYGVTAYTYDSTNPRLIEGDANQLSQLESLQGKRFDAIISRWTLRHLIDPLCCLEQMANMTAEGGELIIDEFSVNAISSTTTTLGRHVVDHLFSVGFVPATIESQQWMETLTAQAPLYPHVPSLHLQRTTNTPVELPVTYDVRTNSWAYVIT